MNSQLEQMDAEHQALYDRIQSFAFDAGETRLTFGQRLVKENGWTMAYAEQAIAEYRRFAFLAVVAGHPVSPSDAVDQVWHLHLTYTRSYWQEFCPNVLQMPFHHEPTMGGRAEQTKHDDGYRRTLSSYERVFGLVPPEDIWPAPDDRWGRFSRVNRQQNWVIRKPQLPQRVRLQRAGSGLAIALSAGLALMGCQATNPLDYTGPEFLTFYLLLSIGVVLFSAGLRSRLRLPDGDGTQAPVLSVYEWAYLAQESGVQASAHTVNVAIASLVQKGWVSLSGLRVLTVIEGEQATDPIERAVLGAIAQNGAMASVRSAAAKATDGLRERLVQLDLLMSAERCRTARNISALPMFGLLGLGLAKLWVGMSRQRPVGFLVVMCAIIAVLALAFLGSAFHRSRYGDRVLKHMRRQVTSQSKVITDPLDSQLPLTFALMGVSVLPEMMFGDFKRSLVPESSGSSGGGSDGGGGGDGCGGGGCGGGCGGCGG
jgi:uncharacterized protein (TIGR04222 family)